CILGRSGVGKSVSLHTIMGFLKPDSGKVSVAYEDITGYSEHEMERIRKKVTMVFQNGALFDSLTVGENVAFPLRERRDLDEQQIYQVVDGLLDMVGVKPMRELLPSDLSTGMKRSVAIARAHAVGSLQRHEAFRGKRPRSSISAGSYPLRRTYYDGGSTDGQPAR